MNAMVYNIFGGEQGIARLVERFYDLMDLEPQYTALRATHSETLDYARERLFQFLSGWLGGSPVYETLHGHPRLRQRHMPFAVDMQTRNQWIACFAQALAETEMPKDYSEAVLIRLFVMADWMRNQDEPEYDPPQPPMAVDPMARLPQLQAVLAEYQVGGFFDEF